MEVENGGGRWTTRGRGGREGCRGGGGGGGEGLLPEWDESGGEASYFVRSVHCPNLPPCIFFSLDSRATPSSATRLNMVTGDAVVEDITTDKYSFSLAPLIGPPPSPPPSSRDRVCAPRCCLIVIL